MRSMPPHRFVLEEVLRPLPSARIFNSQKNMFCDSVMFVKGSSEVLIFPQTIQANDFSTQIRDVGLGVYMAMPTGRSFRTERS